MEAFAADAWGTIAMVVMPLLILYWIYLRVTGQDPEQIRASRARQLATANVNRGPVVYLRSFGAENEGLGQLRYAFTGKAVAGTGAYSRDAGHSITAVLDVIGPPVELARPGGSSSRTPGAPKLPRQEHATDADWREHVLGWLPKAALVVAQVDISGGLGWELGQLRARVSPIKVLLVLPPTQKEYAQVSQWARQYFPLPFPETLPESRLMTFEAGWKPRPLEARSDLYFTLRPVFTANGYESPVRTALEEKQARAAKGGRS